MSEMKGHGPLSGFADMCPYSGNHVGALGNLNAALDMHLESWRGRAAPPVFGNGNDDHANQQPFPVIESALDPYWFCDDGVNPGSHYYGFGPFPTLERNLDVCWYPRRK